MNASEQVKTDPVIKGIYSSALLVVVSLQLYIVIRLFFYIGDFKKLFAEMGSELPGITLLLLKGYPFLILFPILSVIFAVELIRRKRLPAAYSVAVLTVILVLTVTIHLFTTEALYAPILKISQIVGN
jgi:hypothetical protein